MHVIMPYTSARVLQSESVFQAYAVLNLTAWHIQLLHCVKMVTERTLLWLGKFCKIGG